MIIIKSRRLKYFSHIMRYNTLQRTVLDGMLIKMNGSTANVRPRATWTTNIMEWTGVKIMEVQSAEPHMESYCIQCSSRGRSSMNE